jgi:uncharacterized protein YceH (UPF0502 family)
MLDRTEQRIVGVLVEKEVTVPDTYPMSENALVDGCNQKNNRDPVMELAPFQVAGATMSLLEKGWIARIDGGGRVPKYRHKVVERLALTPPELAVLCELLLRGPQAPGALKPRVQRLGFTGTPEQIAAVLEQLASRAQPIVEQLTQRPRERDRRWQHLLGDGSEAAEPAAEPRKSAAAVETAPRPDLEARVAALEHALAALRDTVRQLEAGGGAVP